LVIFFISAEIVSKTTFYLGVKSVIAPPIAPPIVSLLLPSIAAIRSVIAATLGKGILNKFAENFKQSLE
jgi:hypothetical protein